MSFAYASDPGSLLDALAEGDYDTAAMLMGDSQSDLESFFATQTFVNLTGTTDGAGAATVAHNLDLTGSTVILCQAFYDGGSGQHKPLTVTYVDAANVVLAGGGATKALHVTLVVAAGFITF